MSGEQPLRGYEDAIPQLADVDVPAGEAFVPIESPRGEIGFYIVSDGSGRPYKAHVRAPSFYNLAAISKIAEGGLVADLVAIIGSLDPVLGDVDR